MINHSISVETKSSEMKYVRMHWNEKNIWKKSRIVISDIVLCMIEIVVYPVQNVTHINDVL
jgi:hypothetical protein